MIDPNLPLELDDGTPVTLYETNRRGDQIWVRTPDGCSVSRRGVGNLSDTYWYHAKTGVFGGGTKHRYKLLRNVDEPSLYERDLEQ